MTKHACFLYTTLYKSTKFLIRMRIEGLSSIPSACRLLCTLSFTLVDFIHSFNGFLPSTFQVSIYTSSSTLQSSVHIYFVFCKNQIVFYRLIKISVEEFVSQFKLRMQWRPGVTVLNTTPLLLLRPNSDNSSSLQFQILLKHMFKALHSN